MNQKHPILKKLRRMRLRDGDAVVIDVQHRPVNYQSLERMGRAFRDASRKNILVAFTTPGVDIQHYSEEMMNAQGWYRIPGGAASGPLFTLKTPPVEAITFAELVEYGKANGGNIVGGMPWSFHYKGHPVTHENDECYLIGAESVRFTPADMLLSDAPGHLAVMPKAVFDEQYIPYAG